MGELDAAGFAASAGVNLRFDHDDVGFETSGAFASFFPGESHFPAGRGYAIAGEDGFGLIFVNLHRCSVSLAAPARREPFLRGTLRRSTSVTIFCVCKT